MCRPSVEAIVTEICRQGFLGHDKLGLQDVAKSILVKKFLAVFSSAFETKRSASSCQIL